VCKRCRCRACAQGFEVSQVDSSPYDPAAIVATGNGFIRMFRLTEGVLRPVVVNMKREPLDYTCHAWLPDDRLVVGTATGAHRHMHTPFR
jgi:hypothetical protein